MDALPLRDVRAVVVDDAIALQARVNLAIENLSTVKRQREHLDELIVKLKLDLEKLAGELAELRRRLEEQPT